MALPDDLAKDLNPMQRLAVEHAGGPLLVLAGAGSGKTRAITYRIAYLVRFCSVPPAEILALTFTNKAAGEMRKRVEKLLGAWSLGAWIGTFHSVCARILRRHAHLLGYSENFTIYDRDDQRAVIKRVLKDSGISESQVPPGYALGFIEKNKNQGTDPARVKRVHSEQLKILVAVAASYQEKLKNLDAMDFSDLLYNTYLLFEKSPDVLEEYRSRWKHILVDEYQDTNRIQYLILRQLAAKAEDLVVVGDDDQSIYGWRGADIGNILSFEKDFEATKVITLEENYRSTSTILEAASVLISNNVQRKQKRLFTRNPTGSPIKYVRLMDDKAEAKFIAHRLAEQIASGTPPGRCAVFYRTNAQSRLLEQALQVAGIPNVVVGAQRFFERAEIKDAMAYLRVVLNPGDSVALSRIVNHPPRGIGKSTIQRAESLAAKRMCSLEQAFRALCSEGRLSGVPAKGLAGFFEALDRLRRDVESLSARDGMELILRRFGVLDYLKDKDTPESDSRLENLAQLVNAAAEYEELSSDRSLHGFLEQVSLASDIDQAVLDGEAVVLMTVHLAKGLEFDVVFMAGMEDGLFPHARSIEDRSLEEERRLCYVAMTRSRKELYLTGAVMRSTFGMKRSCRESRFLAELPRDLVETMVLSGQGGAGHGDDGGGLFQVSAMDGCDADYFTGTSVGPSFRPGMMVEHPTFGKGDVLDVRGSGPDAVVVIDFHKYGTRKIVARFLSAPGA